MFRKHKFKQFVAKSLGKSSSSFAFPEDYLWKKTRFKIACMHFLEAQKETVKLERSILQNSKDAKTFAKLFETHKNSQYDPSFIGLNEKHQIWMKEEYQTFSKEEIEKYRKIEQFYNSFVDILEKTSNEHEELAKKIQMFHTQIEDLLNDSKNGDKSKETYENRLLDLSIQEKKVVDEKKRLETLEKKRQAKKKMKEKEKLKKQEEIVIKTIAEREEEYEKLKKDTAYQEQRTLDELDYQVKRADLDFPIYMRNLLIHYRNYHSNSLKLIENSLDELGVRQSEIDDYSVQKRKERTFCRKIRDLFKPNIPTVLFGQEIDDVMKRENETGALPKTVMLMIDYISNNVYHEGIFRKPGNSEEMEFLQRHMDLGEVQTLESITYPHTVGSVLKSYVRTLPSPLCPFDIFIAVYEIQDQLTQVQELRKRIETLSTGKQNMLYYLLKLCDKIQQQSNLNKMDSGNLSLVWSMNVIPPSETDPVSLIEITPKVREIMNIMILNFKLVFPNGPPSSKYEKVKMKFFEEEVDDYDDDGKKDEQGNVVPKERNPANPFDSPSVIQMNPSDHFCDF